MQEVFLHLLFGVRISAIAESEQWGLHKFLVSSKQ